MSVGGDVVVVASEGLSRFDVLVSVDTTAYLAPIQQVCRYSK